MGNCVNVLGRLHASTRTAELDRVLGFPLRRGKRVVVRLPQTTIVVKALAMDEKKNIILKTPFENNNQSKGVGQAQ